MSKYLNKALIPSGIKGKGIIFEDSVYFSAGTSIYKLEQDEFNHLIECDGIVTGFAKNKNFTLVGTEKAVFFYNSGLKIGSLNRATTALKCHKNIFAIAVKNKLEIWKVPTKIEFSRFTLITTLYGHSLNISNILIMDDRYIFTSSDDCTVRIFDLIHKTSKVILTTIQRPINLHLCNKDSLIIICEGGAAYFVKYNFKEGSTPVKKDIEDRSKNEIKGSNLLYKGEIAAKIAFEDPHITKTHNIDIPSDLSCSENTSSLDDIKFSIKKRFLASKIICSSGFENYFAIVSITADNKQELVFYKDNEEIVRTHIEDLIHDIAIKGYRIALKGEDKIFSCNLRNEIFYRALEFPRIVDFDIFDKTVICGGEDNKIRLYNGNKCSLTLFDSNSSGKLYSINVIKNIIIAVYDDGYISSFNIQDQICFKSFKLGIKPFSVCVSDDKSFIFVVDSKDYVISVIDFQRSKLIETLNDSGDPIKKIIYHRGFLFSLGIKNLIKWNVMKGSNEMIEFNKTSTGLFMKDNRIFVGFEGEVQVLDLNFNFIDSFVCTLISKHRNEVFNRPKPIEHISSSNNNKYLFIGGLANSLKVIDASSKIELDLLRISNDKELENFKSVPRNEIDKPYDETKVIDVYKMVHSSKFEMLGIMTFEGVKLFESSKFRFEPYEFDVDITEEAMEEYLDKGEYAKALLIAVKLDISDLIYRVVMDVPKGMVENVIRQIPKRFVMSIYKSVIERCLSTGVMDLKEQCLIRCTLMCAPSDITFNNEYREIRKMLDDKFEMMKENYYLLKKLYEN